MATEDPFELLRRRANEGTQRMSYRVSVSPQALKHLLKEYDELRAEVGRKRMTEQIEHGHRNNSERDQEAPKKMRHAHSRGDIAHGHHGWRYDEERPEVKI